MLSDEIQELCFRIELIRNNIRVNYLPDGDMSAYNTAQDEIFAMEEQIKKIREKENSK